MIAVDLILLALQGVLDTGKKLSDDNTIGKEEIQQRLAQFVEHWKELKQLAAARSAARGRRACPARGCSVQGRAQSFWALLPPPGPFSWVCKYHSWLIQSPFRQARAQLVPRCGSEPSTWFPNFTFEQHYLCCMLRRGPDGTIYVPHV